MDAKKFPAAGVRRLYHTAQRCQSTNCQREHKAKTIRATIRAMISRAQLTASAAALLTLASVSLPRAQDITSKDLLDGLANPSRWLTYSGDYTGRRFSP